MTQKRLAGGGERYALTVAMKQPGSEMLLQVFHPVAGSRQGQVRFFRATCQAARLANVDDELQVGQVEVVGHRSNVVKECGSSELEKPELIKRQ